jgi:hypothetical protein
VVAANTATGASSALPVSMPHLYCPTGDITATKWSVIAQMLVFAARSRLLPLASALIEKHSSRPGDHEQRFATVGQAARSR